SEAPWRSPARATTVVVPEATLVTLPSAETVATLGRELVQWTGRETELPLEFFRTADSATAVPAGPTTWAEVRAISSDLTSRTSMGTSTERPGRLAVTIALPSALDSSLPAASTVTTSGLEEAQVSFASGTGRPFRSTGRPVRRWTRCSPKILTGRGE